MELKNLLIVLSYLTTTVNGDEKCQRTLSKIVRSYVKYELLPLYEEYGHPMPKQCKWHLDKDIYGTYEENKFVEGPSKWVCQFCGKGFYEERFLDQHFRNRHPQYLKQAEHNLCFADFCDIFRCDVMLKKNKPKYWDVVLCKEEILKNYQNKCELFLTDCIPSGLEKDAQKMLYKAVHTKLCKFLSCKYFWDLPTHKTKSLTVAAYIFGWMFVTIIFFVYYFVTCTHFFSDDSLLDPQHRQLVDLDYKLRLFIVEGRNALTNSIAKRV